MSHDEQTRLDLMAGLEAKLGRELTAMLMQHVSPQPWSELATKTDLATQIGELRAEMEGGFARLEARFVAQDTSIESRFAAQDATIESRFTAQDATIESRFAAQDASIAARFATQEARFEALIRERIDSQTKLLMFSIIGAMLTTATIAVGSAAF